ncbi:MAG: tripartite tricarboxylate transporter TctB family protein [Thalassovita sp.]
MSTDIKRDVLTGAVVAIFGTWFASYAAIYLTIGTFSQMGSGMFPLLTGLGLAISGLVLVASKIHEMRRSATEETPDSQEGAQWLSLLIVTAAIASFALLIRPFGLVPATFSLIIVSSTASSALRLRTALALAGILSGLAWGIFIVGLGLPFKIMTWPF